MYCEKCGAENLEGANICQQCGGVFVFSKPSRSSGLAVTSMILGISGFSIVGLMGVTLILLAMTINLFIGIVCGFTMFGLMGVAWLAGLVFAARLPTMLVGVHLVRWQTRFIEGPLL